MLSTSLPVELDSHAPPVTLQSHIQALHAFFFQGSVLTNYSAAISDMLQHMLDMGTLG
jgi:hypothetical protein